VCVVLSILHTELHSSGSIFNFKAFDQHNNVQVDTTYKSDEVQVYKTRLKHRNIFKKMNYIALFES